MFYLERVTKKGEGEIEIKLLENGQGFSLEEAWEVKDQKYAGQANANVVVIWYENPPKKRTN